MNSSVVAPHEGPEALSIARNFPLAAEDHMVLEGLGLASQWLELFKDSHSTYRAYRKEVERFLLWLWSFNAIRVTDLDSLVLQRYFRFALNPQPADRWCGPRFARKHTAEWRPFEGPLAASSLRAAKRALSSFFGFLVEIEALRRTPVLRSRVREPSSYALLRPSRAIPYHVASRVLELLKAPSANLKTSRAQYLQRRTWFVIWVLLHSGLRRHELVQARLGALSVENDETGQLVAYLTVVGKGQVRRDVLVPITILANLYWLFTGQESSTPSAVAWFNEQPAQRYLVSPHLQPQTPITSDHLRSIVRKGLDTVLTLADWPGSTQAMLRDATPHWLRKSYATRCLELGVALRHVQAQLGHSASTTTALYQESNMQPRCSALRSAGLL